MPYCDVHHSENCECQDRSCPCGCGREEGKPPTGPCVYDAPKSPKIEGTTRVSLGEYLYLLRTRSHMSQEALALKAGVNRNLVSRFERDMQNCTLDSVQALFGVFGLVLSVDFRDAEKTAE